jgi:hypothetical protein
MKLEPDALVKWVGEDGGWKVGRVMVSGGIEISAHGSNLVRHSHTGELELVPIDAIQSYPMREEWEAKS